ncbi:MAG TPA: hypothetical protein VJQ44_05780 [Gemmatimonadales bacterium]|nr:hypothetical protein [Gemmatimonadales bacterium]
MRPACIRPLLALLLVATFGVRTMAPELMRGCGPSTGVVHHDMDGGGHDHHATHQVDRCECVGHSYKVVFTAPPVRALLDAAVAAFAPVEPSSSSLVRRAAPAHVLPFAQAPPAARLA